MTITVTLIVDIDKDCWIGVYGSTDNLSHSVASYIVDELAFTLAVQDGAIREVSLP